MKRISGVLGVCLMLALPATALAQRTSCHRQPCPAAARTHPLRAVGHAAPTTAATLPFSGLDVVLLLAGVGALVGAGLVVRRAARRVS